MTLPSGCRAEQPQGMDESTQDILVGFDGSPAADAALQWAVDTALLEHRAVRVAIIDDSYAAMRGAAWWPADYWIGVEDQARVVSAKAGREDITVIRRRGPLVPAMVTLAHDASLLVLGSRGHSRVGELFVGSASQHLAGHAPCPVVVVRPAELPDANRIVVGLDGSSASEAALAFACRRARVTGETIAALRAADYGPVHLDRKGQLPEALGVFLTEQEQQLAASVGHAQAVSPDVAIGPEFIALSPAVGLVEASQQASLLVVGSRGLNAFTGMLLGSVSHEVLHRAQCPVVVVR